MTTQELKSKIRSYDERRNLSNPLGGDEMIQFCLEHFVSTAETAIHERGSFHVALAGGNTPKAIYQGLLEKNYKSRINWNKVYLYWSDERPVPPYDPESNYRMAMEAAFSKLQIPLQQIHRMQAEGNIEEGALAYEKLLQANLPEKSFDLMMLGMGEDGHVASLFPETHALHTKDRLAIENYIPQKEKWRMTVTFDCINRSRTIAVYLMGKSKADTLKRVLTGPYRPDHLPAQRVGSPSRKALWIADKEALSSIQL